MASDSAAVSPAAPAPKAESGDGSGKSGNVTGAQMIQRFVEAEKRALTQTAGTSPAPEATSGEPQTSSAAELANADSPETTPEAPPEGQAQAQPEEGEDGEGAEALSPESSQELDPKLKAKIDRKFGKLTARTKQAEGKAAQLEAKLAQLEAQLTTVQQQRPADAAAAIPSQPAATPPIPDIKDAKALAEYKSTAKETLRFTEQLLENDEFDWSNGYNDGQKVWTKAEIRAAKNGARYVLDEKIPAQEEYFRQQATYTQQRQQALTYAAQQMPWLNNKESDEFKLATEAYHALTNPSLRDLNLEFYSGLMALGLQQLKGSGKGKGADAASALAQAAAAAKPVPAPKPKPPGDQTAVSAAGVVARSNPAAQQVPKPQGNQTQQSAADILAARERARFAQR